MLFLKLSLAGFLIIHSEDMKPAVDEMFPEGAGPYVDLDEVRIAEMFFFVEDEAGDVYFGLAFC